MPVHSSLLLALLLGGSHPLAADILYTVTNLGVLSVNGTTLGTAVNNQEQVTGYSNPAPNQAFLYTDGQIRGLGTLGGPQSYGTGINDAGQVVGSADTATSSSLPYHAFLYSQGQMIDLNNLINPTLGLTLTNAQGINNTGQVTGYGGTSSSTVHAFLYANGRVTDIGALIGGDSYGLGINDKGQVTGWAIPNFTTGGYPFLYTDGQMKNLGTLGAGGVSVGEAINNLGQVVGESNGHAFFYTDGQMRDLGTLGGSYFSQANSINDDGQIVGFGSTSINGPSHAFLYSNGHLQDLNDLIDPALHLTLYEATAVNDNGQIVANSSGGRTYLLTPVPEPDTLALFGVALLGLGAWARRLSIS